MTTNTFYEEGINITSTTRSGWVCDECGDWTSYGQGHKCHKETTVITPGDATILEYNSMGEWSCPKCGCWTIDGQEHICPEEELEVIKK